jgi:glycosyltransferase involved in cell wall biosynthesis
MKKTPRQPGLEELPLPPARKSGWPWNTGSQSLAEAMPDGSPWPRVSVITPSYNQGEFIEETIRSVLLQGYANLEYIIVDGGSTDATLDVIRKYGEFLSHWESRPDEGQADAINQGFARSTGEIMGWINSDDTYQPGAVAHMVQALLDHPACRLVHGEAWYINEKGKRIGRIWPEKVFSRAYLLNRDPIVQPTTFWWKDLWQQVGPLRNDLNWAFDWDWYIRANSRTRFLFVSRHIANYRAHRRSKTRTFTGRRERHTELAYVTRHHGGPLQPTALMYRVWVPFYHLEDIVGGLNLPDSMRSILLAAVQMPPRCIGGLLNRLGFYHQTT